MYRPSTQKLTQHLFNSFIHTSPKLASTQSRGKAMGLRLSRARKDDAAQIEDDLFMLVGLGNPGPRYDQTRHNVGFMAIDQLSQELGIRTDRLQHNCQVARGRIFDNKVLLAKPITFMNNSGEGIGKLSRYYGIPPERILVIYDDLDTATATVRLRLKGGHGGHNGMRSAIQHLGTQDFPRCKIGISRPPEGMQVATYVLQDFTKAEKEKIDGAVVEAIEAAKAWMVLGGDKAVSGLRVDKVGNTITPKGNHQNGKGVKQPKQQQKPAAAAAAAIAKQQKTEQQQQQQQPQSAMAAAIAAATAAKSE